MSFTVTVSSKDSAIARFSYKTTPQKPGATWAPADSLDQMFTNFNEIASQYKQYSLESVKLEINTSVNALFYFYEVTRTFDAATLTYDTAPAYNYLSQEYSGQEDHVWLTFLPYANTETIKRVLYNGFMISPASSSGLESERYYTAYSSPKKPKLIFTFSDTKQTLNVQNPSQYKNNVSYGERNTVSWSQYLDGNLALVEPTMVSKTLYYKQSTASTWTQVSVTNNYYSIPAFRPTSTPATIQWYVTGVDSTGHQSQTAQMQYTEAVPAPAPAASAPSLLYPADDTIDGESNVEFRWTASTSTSNRTLFEFEICEAGSSSVEWTDTFGPSIFTFTLPAGTLGSGQYQWRGRAYNADDVAGSWSSYKNFTVIASPPAPLYQITNTPRPTITWESDEQEAYQVRIGDYDSGTRYGKVYSFTSPEYLPDGETMVQVRVLNSFNLWSPWAGNTITIANNPGPTTPELSGATTDTVLLAWSTVSSATKYRIYRDGIEIGQTIGANFQDPWSIGTHEYFVRAERAGNNYADSNVLTLTLAVNHPIIADVKTGEWIVLKYTTEPVSQSSMTQSQMVSFMVLSGSEYPVAEMSPHREQTLQIRVAFRDGEEKVFEDLLGRECFLKDQYGTAFRGVMDSISSTRNRFYTVCAATLRRVAE